MNKRKLHHVWRYLRHVHPWYFLVLTIIFGAISVVSLRHNNENMIKLRDAVYVADKNGGDVEGALRDLRSYIYSHMNTGLASGTDAVYPPIQLKYTYERLQAAQQQELGQNNGALYGQAQQTCNASGQTATAQQTIDCIQQYSAEHGVQLASIPDALYKFDFIATKWSPDIAGWSLLFTGLFFFVFVFSAAYHWFMRKYL